MMLGKKISMRDKAAKTKTKKVLKARSMYQKLITAKERPISDRNVLKPRRLRRAITISKWSLGVIS